jgi:hypothetical protein
MDDFFDSASRDPFCVWGVGVVGALALAIYGSTCIYGQSATFGGDVEFGGTPIDCRGASAIAFGIAWVAVAGLLHCHFF